MITAKRNPNKFHLSYKINEELGRGNFSTVYSGKSIQNDVKKAANDDGDNEYAIKCIPKEKLNNDDLLAIFDEVGILQQLYHPHIIQLYDFFEENNFFYLIMEKLTGGELLDRITFKEFYSEREARNVVRTLLEAIAYMHGKGVVHRDLKPENLLLVNRANDQLVKIADFGFSKVCNDSINDGMGSLTTQLGTPMYVSPEVIKNIPYGSKTDMWSLGVITYILIGGFPPFMEDDQRELFRKICNGEYEFDDMYFNCVSDDAKTLISSLLEINPKKRLSAKQALSNKWICSDDETLVKNDLTCVNLQKLKQFNAKRKVRAAVHSLIAVNRLTSLLCGDLRIKVTSPVQVATSKRKLGQSERNSKMMRA